MEFRSLPSLHSFSAFSRQPSPLTSSLNLSFCLPPLASRCPREQICTNLQKSPQLPIFHVDGESPKTLKPNEFRNHLEWPRICERHASVVVVCRKLDRERSQRRALQVPSASSKGQVQILYLLGRTLESLNRIPEALETYRWLLRETPQYRDVAMRIESLSTRRISRENCKP